MKKVKTTIYADYNKLDIALLESFRSPSSHKSMFKGIPISLYSCLLYTSDAADDSYV